MEEDKKNPSQGNPLLEDQVCDTVEQAIQIQSSLAPEVVNLESLGTDSSSVVEITSIYVEEEKQDPFTQDVIAWHDKLVGRKSMKREDLSYEIGVGIEIARDGSNSYSEFLNLSQMTLAGRAIQIGRVLFTLKTLSRQAGFLWEIWANNNLSFIRPRQRERCMLLASRLDCYPYIALGVERLELLCAATKNIKDQKDPIGGLLKKYDITFTEDSAESLAAFKAFVDAALKNERLLKNGISVNFDIVKQLTFSGVEVNQNLINRLKETKISGGSEERYLELLAMNKGKVVPSGDTEKRYQDFNVLSNRLMQTLDYITKGDQTQFERIDTDALLTLLEKLQAFKTLVIQDVISDAT